MAAALTPELRRLLSAVHRRSVIARVAERTGLGALAGSAVGLVAAGASWGWAWGPTFVPAAAAVFGGGAAGLAWGVARRPTRLAAAVAADRQLGLDDLLGTAVGLFAPTAGGRGATASQNAMALRSHDRKGVVKSRRAVLANGPASPDAERADGAERVDVAKSADGAESAERAENNGPDPASVEFGRAHRDQWVPRPAEPDHSRAPTLLTPPLPYGRGSLNAHLAAAAAAAPAPWAAVVLATAESACRGRRPSSVRVTRFSPRAWAGVGLAVALTMTLAALADPTGRGSPADVAIGTEAGGPTDPSARATRPTGRPLVALASDAKLRGTGPAGPAEEKTTPGGLADAAATQGTRPPESATRPAGRPGDDDGRDPPAAGDPTGGGAGFAQTDRRDPPADAHRPTPPTPANPGQSPAEHRVAGGGIGRPDAPPPGDPSRPRADGSPATVAGGTSAAGDHASPPPAAAAARVSPWQAPTWQRDARVAREQLDAGRVPPAYRDLVRRYFDDDNNR